MPCKYALFASYGILYFFVLAPLFINIIFSITLRCWRSKNVIKTTKKRRGSHISMAGFILSMVMYGFTQISNTVILGSQGEIMDDCYRYKNESNCPFKNDFTAFSIIFDISNILSIFIVYAWIQLYQRIKKELDEPPSFKNIEIQTDSSENEENIPFKQSDNNKGNSVSVFNYQNIPNKIEVNSSENNKIETIESQDVFIK